MAAPKKYPAELRQRAVRLYRESDSKPVIRRLAEQLGVHPEALHFIYTYPAKKSLKAVMAKVKTLCRQVEVNQPLDELIRRLNQAVRGWCAYFRPGVSSATFAYLSHYLWQRVWRWLRRKHRRATWKELRRQYCDGGWWPRGQRELFDPEQLGTTRYRYRGSIIPSPWPTT